MLMRRALALIPAAVLLVSAAFASGALADDIGEGELLSLMKQCSAALRALPENNNSLKIPKVCNDAAREFDVDAGGGRKYHVDNTWIASDLHDIGCALQGGCVPCIMSRRATKKMHDEAKKNKKEKKGNNASGCEEGCSFCDDPVPENKSSVQLLAGLADAVAAAAVLRDDKPATDKEVARAEAAARSILATDEYQRFKEKDKDKKKERKWPWLEKLIRWIEKLLGGGDREPAVPGKRPGLSIDPASATDALRTLIAAVIILAVAFAAAMIIIRFKRTLADEAVEEEEQNGEPAKAAKQMLSEAEELRRRGEYRLAMRSLFHAFLRLLEQKGLVVYIKNKTNGEYLRELRKKGKSAPEAERLNLLFEEAWYGMKQCGESDYAEFLAAYEKSTREV